jgi:hypothetical protein
MIGLHTCRLRYTTTGYALIVFVSNCITTINGYDCFVNITRCVGNQVQHGSYDFLGFAESSHRVSTHKGLGNLLVIPQRLTEVCSKHPEGHSIDSDLVFPHSFAMTFVAMMPPALLIEYTGRDSSGLMPATELTVMIDPPPCSLMLLATA